jgi:8-oxo-dGTP diphosphatase
VREVTLLFPVRSNRVLLGLKKDGFGRGRLAGFGGGLEPGETLSRAAVRELFEECGLDAQPEALEPAGLIEFEFSVKSSWNQRVHVFLLRSWSGEPFESDEMRPEWFEREALPFAQMWDDARY